VSELGQYEIAAAVEATLWKWLPTHVLRWARARGVSEDDLASNLFPWRTQGTSIVSAFSNWAIEELPHVQIMSRGWRSTEGDQTGLAATYEVAVAVVVSGFTEPETALRRACFEDGIRDTLVKHADLGGVAASVNLIGGGPPELPDVNPDDARTFQGSAVIAEVLALGVTDPRNGPTTPDPLSPGPDGVPPAEPGRPTVADSDTTPNAGPRVAYTAHDIDRPL
jgi:hypothetical protein